MRFGVFDGPTVTYEELEEHAEYRRALHADQQTQRILNNDNDLIGLMGEWAFSLWSGLPLNLAARRNGDRGVDFYHPRIGTIDVKTANCYGHLYREANKRSARCLVLAFWKRGMAPNPATLLGWEWDEEMCLIRPQLSRWGVLNHGLYYTGLHKMPMLANLMNGNI